MKMLLHFIAFCLISGSVHCSAVIGYPGGRVIIEFRYPVNMMSTVYICKYKTQTECEPLLTARVTTLITGNMDRFILFYTDKLLTFIFKKLNVDDTGSYEVGVIGDWSHNINLKVNSDPCCNRRETVTGYLGQTVTISCSYPVEFNTNTKIFYRLDCVSETELIRTSGTEPHQDGRFFISDDGRNKVFSVNIGHVTEDDRGNYSCAVYNEETAVSYHSLFTTIHLQVTGLVSLLPKHLTQQGSSVITIIITTAVCVCLTLLLIGGSVLVHRLRSNKTQDSAPKSHRTGTNNTPAFDYENDPLQIQNITIHPVYQNLNPNTPQSDSLYQQLDPNTNPSDSVYQRLDPNTKLSDTVYQSLNPNSNQIYSHRV